MKKSLKSIGIVFSFAVLLSACESNFDSLVNERLENNPLPETPEYNAGSANFSNYIAIGNSLTAGFMDGALYTDGQQSSFPVMLSQQFQTVGAPAMVVPEVNSVNGFHTALSDPANGVIFGRTKLDVTIPGPVPTTGEYPIPPITSARGTITNLGVPGIRVGDLFSTDLAGTPALGLFYSRFGTNPGTSTIISDAVAANPTFFSMWIGNNDVLQYAMSGGISETLITSQADFQTNFGNALGAMVQTGAKGVVLNIPPLVVLPFFQAVKWNAIPLDEATATALNAGLASVNGAIQACASAPLNMITPEDASRRQISYTAGSNPILVVDEELDDLGTCFDLVIQGNPNIPDAQKPAARAQLVPYEQSRPLVAGELVLLTAGAVLNTPFGGDANKPIGIVVPLGFNADGSLSGDQYYLTAAEQVNIVTARATFNAVIDGVVAATNQSAGGTAVAITDVHPFFADIFGLNVATATGLAMSAASRNAQYADGVIGANIDGVILQPDFSPNGIFSTDAVHPNARGHAIIANEILKTIRSTFGATLPDVDVLNYPSVVLAQ